MAVIIQINTGHEIKTLNDTYLDIANEVGKTLTGGGPPGATGVDILPLRACQAVERYLYADAALTVRYLPSWCDPTGSTAFVRKLRHSVKEMYTVPYDRVTEDIVRLSLQFSEPWVYNFTTERWIGAAFLHAVAHAGNGSTR